MTAPPGGRAARLDLHMHSTLSDGLLSPEDLLSRCINGRLHVVAITDHDVAPALSPGVHRRAFWTLHLLDAVELSGVHDGKELHLLVYFPKAMPDGFRDFLTQRAAHRARRFDAAVQAMGLTAVPPAGPDFQAGRRAVTRHHLARAMVEAGVVSGIQQAFDLYLSHRHGWVPKVDLPFTEAIARARAAGGVTSWAHPDPDDVRAYLGDFVKAGLQGLESARPAVGRHVRGMLQRCAHKRGLIQTGGSDWHGWNGGSPGAWSFPAREGRAFLRAMDLA